MTIPQAAQQAGISKPTAYNRVNAALSKEGLTLADILVGDSKQIKADRLQWVKQQLSKKTVNGNDTETKSLKQSVKKLTDQVNQLKEREQDLVKRLEESQAEVERLKQHQDALLQQSTAQSATIAAMTQERLKLIAPAQQPKRRGLFGWKKKKEDSVQ